MKKINTTKIMALLFSACLITSSFVGSTLAKYVTTAEANDTARVAKWGVVLQADGNLYGDDYIDAIDLSNNAATLAVMSNDDTNVVAPGTNNADGLAFAVNGTPEVATKLTAKIEAENIYLSKGTYAVMVKAPEVTADSFKDGTYYTEDSGTYALATAFAAGTEYYTMTDKVVLGATYYPVIYSADVTGTYAEDTLNNIAKDYVKKLTGDESSSALAAYQKEEAVVVDGGKYTYEFVAQYNPNFDYSSLNVAGDALTWAWAFEGQNDGADTILGNLMAGELADAKVIKVDTVTGTMTAPVEAAGTEPNDYNLNTSFSITLTVEQIDKVASTAQ